MKVEKQLYKVHIDSTSGNYGVVSEGDFNSLRSKYEQFDFLSLNEFNVDGDEAPLWYSNKIIKDEECIILTADQVTSLAINNIPFKVNQNINVDIDITKQLIDLSEKPIKLIQENNGGDTYNNKCEVHLPGNTLSMYNETMLMEDSCTDELQSSLNSGWRIIAACPQPDQRRPDYILGRFNPNIEVSGSAERK